MARRMYAITDLYLTTTSGEQEEDPLIPCGTHVTVTQIILDHQAAGGADCMIEVPLKLIDGSDECVSVWCELRYISPSYPASRPPIMPIRTLINPLTPVVSAFIIWLIVTIFSPATTRL